MRWQTLRGTLQVVLVLTGALLSAGCDRPAPTVTPVATTVSEPQPRAVASIQELMRAMVDPTADEVWGAVGTTITAAGVEEHSPRTDEEWQQLRLHALALLESTNLLLMPGRRVVAPGSRITDEGFQGVLTSEQAQNKLVGERAAFVQLAAALGEVAGRMLQAIDARQLDQMLELGTELDEVCESCHVVFWYPQQLLPSVPANLIGKDASP